MYNSRVPTVFLTLYVTAPWAVSAPPSAAGRSASLKAAAALCPAVCSAFECSSHGLQTAEAIQNMTTATVLTCDSLHRQPFLEAIALFRPSGYLDDSKVVPYIVVQPSGMSRTVCWAQFLLTLHCPYVATMQRRTLQSNCAQAFASFSAVTEEVQQAVKAAVAHNLTLAVKGGGYSWVHLSVIFCGQTWCFQ